MKTALVYDSSDELAVASYKTLEGLCRAESDTFKVIDVSAKSLSLCIGCFGCWVKTPGVCVFTKDSGDVFLSNVFDADFLVIISRITWGGYSSSVKAYMDRMLPVLHPFFVKRNGEMHHRLRYHKMPSFLTLGFGAQSEREEKTFMQYTNAHRDNMADGAERHSFIWKNRLGESASFPSDACAQWFLGEIKK